ncbi:4-coumarate--CoA ligase-like 7 [Chrysoperla carnea]|uniref:4-coumarate--CoA ligase-like 7 n=1 Tax=Chrysoperla carnea TaxID=189513 RepID=UPI001D082BEF|nr:4-coumarate--CoA ligase-like 7 [Chrysoperla carnea]
MCTSGFTGPRRIVPYTQNFFYNTIYRMQNIVTRHDILLNILPLCHWGAVWSLLFCLVFGSTNIAVEWSSSMNTLKLIEKFKLRLIWSRGKSIPTEQMKFMRSVFQCTHLVNCYACVEFGGCVTHFDPTYEYDMNVMKINSVGRLRRGCEAKIVDIETRKLLGPNQDGELLVKTINMPRKYYSRNIEPDYTEDGWYVTGDYAKFDEEQCLYIISPHDIEYIITRMPTVRSCGVVGLPDPVLGEVPVAFVVKEPNAVVTEKDIIKTVALEGKDYQRLRGGVHFISQLPSSVVGGISRRELRKLLPTLKPNNSCKCGWI